MSSTEEEAEIDQELETLAEEVMRKYLGSVRADIRSRAVEAGFEEIVAEKIEIPEEIQKVLEEVPAERISPAEVMRDRINETISKLNELIKSSRENIKGVIIEQYVKVRKYMHEIGSMVALALVNRIGASHLRHRIQVLYKDIVENELKAKESGIIKDTLAPLEAFFKGFIQHVSELSGHILGLREAYEKWLVEYGTILRDFLEEEGAVSEIEELMEKNKQLKQQLTELEGHLEKCNIERMELRAKIGELEKQLKEKTEELASSALKEVEKLKAEYESKLEKYVAEITDLQRKLATKERELEEADSRIRKLEEEFLKRPDLEELKKMYERRLEEKDRLIEHLKAELEKRIESGELAERYKEMYSKYISLSEENRLLKDEVENLRKENERLMEEVSKMKGRLLEIENLERLKVEYETKLIEKDKIIQDLRVQLSRLATTSELAGAYQELRAQYTAAMAKIGILENELKNKNEEITGLLKQIDELNRRLAEQRGLEEVRKVYEQKLAEKDAEIITLKNKVAELQESLAALEGLRKEFEAIRDLVSRPAVAAPEVPMDEHRRILEGLKDELLSLREQLGERQKRVSELEAIVKVYEDQIKLMQEQLAAYKRGILVSDQEFTELKRENAALKERLRVLEERYNELSRSLDIARREPEELKTVLSETPLGKIYLQLRALKRASIDLLARALGMPRLTVLRELQALAKMGLVKLTENQAIYQGQL